MTNGGEGGGGGGAAGFLFANATEFVAPAYISWQRSGELLFMVILGGVAGLHGAMIGALGFVLLEEWLSHQWEHWRILFGVGLPILVIRSCATIFLGDLGNDPSWQALAILGTIYFAKLAVTILLFQRLRHNLKFKRKPRAKH